MTTTKTIEDLQMCCYREYNKLARISSIRGRLDADEVVSEAYIAARKADLINQDGTLKPELSLARRSSWSLADALIKANGCVKQTQADGTQKRVSRTAHSGDITALVDGMYSDNDHTKEVDEADERKVQMRWIIKNLQHLNPTDKKIMALVLSGVPVAEIARKLKMRKKEVFSRRGYHIECLKKLAKELKNDGRERSLGVV